MSADPIFLDSIKLFFVARILLHLYGLSTVGRDSLAIITDDSRHSVDVRRMYDGSKGADLWEISRIGGRCSRDGGILLCGMRMIPSGDCDGDCDGD